MPRLRAAVGTIHGAHEVRRRRAQAELDRPVVERAHADDVPVGVAAEVRVLPLLEREVDGDRGAGALGIEDALDPELDVVGGERSAVGPGQAVAEMEDVPEPVVRDLPALGQRGHDRPLGPRLDQPVE